MNMKILILGGNRFTGKLFAERLVTSGFQVTCINRSGTGPIGSMNLQRDRHDGFDMFGIAEYDMIFDFCAYQPQDVIDVVHRLSSFNTYVLISSGSVYKDSDQLLLSVGMPTGGYKAFGQYGISKSECEAAVMASNTKWKIIRPPFIIGEHDPHERIQKIVNICRKIYKSSYKPKIGICPVSLIWETDYVDALVNIVHQQILPNEILNISGNDIYTGESLARSVYKYLSEGEEIIQETMNLGLYHGELYDAFKFMHQNYIMLDNSNVKKLGVNYYLRKYIKSCEK